MIVGAWASGGRFVLDVTTPAHRRRHGHRNHWYAAETGFWKPGPHLVLEDGFDYPDQAIFLDQSIVVEPNGRVSVYRMWFQDYTRETITGELAEAGYVVCGVWNDLVGTPFSPDTGWIGLVARKAAVGA